MSEQLTDINDFYEELEKIENGEQKPFEAYVQLKALIDEAKTLKDRLKDHVTREASEYPDGDPPVALGHKIEVRSRTNYSYKECDIYNRLSARRKKLKDQIKMATNDPDISITDEETGEIIEPVSKSETTYPVVKQMKEEQV